MEESLQVAEILMVAAVTGLVLTMLLGDSLVVGGVQYYVAEPKVIVVVEGEMLGAGFEVACALQEVDQAVVVGTESCEGCVMVRPAMVVCLEVPVVEIGVAVVAAVRGQP